MAQEADDLATKANEAINASEWSRAVELYAELTEVQPENATAWYRLGLATSRSEGDASDARTAYQKALELGFPQGPALYGIARSHAAEGDAGTAMATLERLAEQGPSPFVVSQIQGEAAFASLSSNERFQGILKRLTPCTGEEYRQFDFWIGAWNVVGPQGQALGTNRVDESMDGCMLIENWVSALGGQKGMSINYYDNVKGTWSQIYRDNSGSIAQWPELVGGIEDGAMVLDSGPDTNPRSRWKWSKESDGRVRQMAESTTDGGETWAVVWDSYYVRAEE
jgi:tetratricopeptide (TPR) repeat protein